MLKQKIKKIIKSFIQATNSTIKHDGIEHAGYLSFLLMLSIFPFLVFFMAIVGKLGSVYIANNLVEIIVNSTLVNFIEALRPRIMEITSGPPQGLLTVAILSAIWTASSIFEALRAILNKAYRVNEQPAYVLRRLFSIFEFILIITMTILIMFIFGVLPSLMSKISSYLDFDSANVIKFIESETKQIRYFILLGYGYFLVSFLYYFLPNKKQKFLWTFPGTISVILGWTFFTKLFKYYVVSFSQINVIYGSITGIIIALLYFYFCSVIFIFGAELNYQLETKLKNSKGNDS